MEGMNGIILQRVTLEVPVDKSDFQRLLRERLLIFDGGFGTELYRKGFFLNTSYDGLVLTNPKVITSIHQAYLDAGSEVLTTNTYNANAIKLAEFGLAEKTAEINETAVALAKKASAGKNEVLIAGSIGPITVDFPETQIEQALRQQACALEKGGADILIFESLNGLRELRRVLSVARDLAIAWFPSFVLDADALLADKGDFAQILALLGDAPAAIGLNCGLGPDVTLEALQKIHEMTKLPFIVQPGAGNPRVVDNRFMPMTTPEYFTTYALRYTTLGARGVGGCCGIGPDHIADLARSLQPLAKTEHAAVFEAVKRENRPQPLEPTPLSEISPFSKKLAEGKWLRLLELLPPKGYDLTETIEKAKLAKLAGFDAINLPDGPRAGCRVSQVVTAIEIQEHAQMETIVHCCCRDRNLISLQSMILGCMAKNLRNILFITGDPPKLGNYPFSSGVFDVDSIGMLRLMKDLNRGIDVGGFPLGPNVKTAICAGAGADPNAIDQEREYRRLAEKIANGAQFIITQPVFDPAVLCRFLKRVKPLGCPVIAGVWPFSSYRNALFMKTEVPGVVVPDWIMDAMKNAGDKIAQRETGISIARKIIAEIRSEVRGIATSAPLGNVSIAMEVCKEEQ